ncbi:MAG: hypothetical protein KDK36_01065 [Leptospiraceae bacterium]|nr:hypothetical protein [Leptospiraceae bacterium]
MIPALKRIFLFSVFFLIFSPISTQENEENRTEFLRLTDSALQTAVYTLGNEDSNIKIKIIGVIHVGDPIYYREILSIIQDLDYLFYEGIRLNNAIRPNVASFTGIQTEESEKLDNNNSVKGIATFQNEIARYFNFVEQGDYLKPQENWINADVTFNEFLVILKKSNLNLDILTKNLTLDAKSALEEDSEETKEKIDESDKHKFILKYKRKMAKYLVKSAEELCYDEEMRIPREAIIIERNKVALSFLNSRLFSPQHLELGLLYGAAHLPHFLEVLQKEHKFQIHTIEWLDAWSLKSN